VLFMHGWPDTHALWQPQIDALARAGYRTIAPDLRGFGASDMPNDTDAYKLEHTVADMVAVLDALGVEQASVVAHDWGAAAAWGLAAFVPARVDRLAALSVGHPSAFLAAGWEQRMRSWYMLLFNFDGIAEAWLDKFGSLMLSSHPGRDDVLATWRDNPRAVTAGLQWYRANAHPRSMLRDQLAVPPVTCPVLGVWSTRDVALTEAQMTGSQEYVDGPWRYERIEGAGHWMQLEVPDRLVDLLLRFLPPTDG
jgi:pimeloyl-ACP methyl ester carboxylesterase